MLRFSALCAIAIAVPLTANAQQSINFPVASTSGWSNSGCGTNSERGTPTASSDLDMTWTDTTEAGTASVNVQINWKFLCSGGSYDVYVNGVRLGAGTNAGQSCVCHNNPYQTTSQTFNNVAIVAGGTNTLRIRETGNDWVGFMNNGGFAVRATVTPGANQNPTINAPLPATGSYSAIAQPILSANVSAPETGERAHAQFAVDGGAYVDGSRITTSGRSELTTAALTDGSHTWTARARDLRGGFSSAIGPHTVIVDTTAPAVSASTLGAPNGGEVLAGGATTTITWTPPTDLNLAALPITLLYSTDGGANWTTIATGLANDGSEDWTVPSADSANVLIRIVAEDLAGNTASDDSDVAMRIDSTPPAAPGTPVPNRNPTNVAVALSWADAADAGGSGVALYDLEVSANGGLDTTSLGLLDVATFVHDSGEGRFVYRARAYDVVGNASAWSPWSEEVVTDLTAPTTPGSPAASPNPNGRPGTPMTIAWIPSVDTGGSGQITYALERSADLSAWTPIATTPGSGGVDAPASGIFFYRVLARDAAGNESGYSDPSGAVVVDEAPVALPASYQMLEDERLDLTLGSTDLENDTLTWLITGLPVHGTLDGGMQELRVYVPEENFAGHDSFVVQAHDGVFASNLATIDIEVLPVNDAPVLTEPLEGASFAATEGAELVVALTGQDVDTAELTFTAEGLPSGAVLDPAGFLRWTPLWTDAGTHQLTVTVSDGELSDSAPIGLVVSFVDADADGVADTHERELGLDPETDDTDGDGIPDGTELGDGETPLDTDGDGIPDALDDDSDGDGIPDIDEVGDDDVTTPPVDTDEDGVPDYLDTDSDDDGTEDSLDLCPIVSDDQTDTDADGAGDACDEDDDGDGLTDAEEEELGLDPLDPDSDGDGIPDKDEVGDIENPIDTDGDGIPDHADPDVDGDGVDDVIDLCPLVADVDQTDTDGDGDGDACDGDLDGDGVADEDDLCPTVSDADQADRDGDGVGDACAIAREQKRAVADSGGCGCQSGSGGAFAALLVAAGLLVPRRRSR